MPLRLDVKRKLLARSDRIKSVDLHPTEPWMLVSLYNGNVHIWNYDNQQLVKSFEVCDLPVRAAKFVPRKNWIITGSDDMFVRVYNYNTLERVHQFEAHSDYLRSIAVHPTQPFVLTSSDDMQIKLWDWDNKWQMKQNFEGLFTSNSGICRTIQRSSVQKMTRLFNKHEHFFLIAIISINFSLSGHTHYVMQLVVNPKDNNTFATASLDKTIKVWQFGSPVPNFTLEGHTKGVNCVDYYHGGDKPYIISGADDHLVKIWDYQNKTCVATLDGHSHNISAVCFHPELPIIITGSEDSTVRIWHANTYRLETTMSYGLERVWCITALKGSNTIAIGYDEGSVAIKLGREEPAVSMDSSGKILWAKHSEMQQVNLKQIDPTTLSEARDGERLSISVKDMGACEIYPQTVQHSSNGRYVVTCGDGEYIIYTATALRNKAFGSGLEFVWAKDPNLYAVRESSSMIKIHKNFKELHALRPDIVVEGIDGGVLLAARSSSSLCFYDWETAQMVRRIEIAAKHVFWSEDGELCAVISEDSFYILKFNLEIYENVNPEDITEDGIEDLFEVVGEQAESVKTGIWVGDCFIFTTSLNRLSYYVGGEIVTIAHLDHPIYLLGYIEKDNRIYACDKDHNIVSYKLLLSVLQYQTAVMRRDFDAANQILKSIPRDQKTRVAQFLEKQGFKKQALDISQDPEHRFELAIALGNLDIAKELAQQADSEEKWRQLGQAAQLRSDLVLAGECLQRAKDYGGLLLLASCAGSPHLMNLLANDSHSTGNQNVAFLSTFLLGDVRRCLDILVETDRLPEAAFFARTYAPSEVPRIVSLWRDKVTRTMSGVGRNNIGESIADPVKYENLFPGYADALKAEQFEKQRAKIPTLASQRGPLNADRDVLEEMREAEERGDLHFNDDGSAVLRGVDTKAASGVSTLQTAKASPLVAAAVNLPQLDVPKPRSPTPSPPPPNRSSQQPEDDEEEEEEEDEEPPARSLSRAPQANGSSNQPAGSNSRTQSNSGEMKTANSDGGGWSQDEDGEEFADAADDDIDLDQLSLGDDHQD
ncbi:WD40 repeat and Coatomer domain containing protein [Aphelenchoides besseyi]|nr:WD40 repeat and Coatomer domain containing protein [Aphelenchoides besseyi]